MKLKIANENLSCLK